MRNVERAKQIAREKGVSFAFVCSKIGKSRGYLAEILTNGRDIPDKMLEPVAIALGVSVDYLTGQTDDPVPEQKEKAPQSDVDRLMEGLNAESIRKLREYAELLKLGQEQGKEKP